MAPGDTAHRLAGQGCTPCPVWRAQAFRTPGPLPGHSPGTLGFDPLCPRRTMRLVPCLQGLSSQLSLRHPIWALLLPEVSAPGCAHNHVPVPWSPS